ncbi:adenylyl-sulfate kinase [Undibacterium fentianense]|uniref:Adenylyl-sulfate kinase n=1 Tax=Undibacterium fentianense TaxID=2828728 RepID=A0A941IFG3_9BURK|nr:adenylyl-sulfate kinase [Undibacterium fentianense]MBR7800686.1 adenylyl-sulfate kinase [Undibacterium fentianense]
MAIQSTSTPKFALTWWLTGLSGAGKSTLAQALAQRLRQQQMAVCVLDGDELRSGLSKDLGFSSADREEQARRVAEIAKILNQSGIFAIVALISPTEQGRQMARDIIGTERMTEVYVSTPLEVCQQRDVKGLYRQAKQELSLQLTGVRSPYQEPRNPEMTIDTSVLSIEEALAKLLGRLDGWDD